MNKQWLVLEFVGNSESVHSIKRLSDNEVFTIGDKVTNGTKMKGKIEKFTVSFKGDVFVYTDWSGVGMGLESITHIIPLSSEHQIGDDIFFAIDGSKLYGKIHGVSFLKERVKYDLELIVDRNDLSRKELTRIYNVESNFVIKRE